MSEAIASFLGKLGGDKLKDVIDGFTDDIIRGAAIVSRVELASSQDWLKSITADALDSMIEEDANANAGLSAQGLVNIFERFIKTVAYASTIMPVEIVEELYTEMLQEGFSNAIQVSVGGALQSILSTWRGGYPLNADEASEVVETVEDLDADTIGLLVAQSGSNVPTSMFRMKQGFDRYVEKELIALRTQLFEITNRLNDLIAYKVDRSTEIALRQLDESLNVIREAYSKAISLYDMVLERALSRLQELKNECETVKSWLEWSQEHPDTPIISQSEADIIAAENMLEAQSIVSSVDSILTNIDNSLSGFDVTLDNVLSNIDACVSNEVTHLNKMIQQGVLDVQEAITKINNAIDILVAYRNASDLQTSPSTSLEKSISGAEVTPTLPETYSITITVYGG